jgi:hypothetical protein
MVQDDAPTVRFSHLALERVFRGHEFPTWVEGRGLTRRRGRALVLLLGERRAEACGSE